MTFVTIALCKNKKERKKNKHREKFRCEHKSYIRSLKFFSSALLHVSVCYVASHFALRIEGNTIIFVLLSVQIKEEEKN